MPTGRSGTLGLRNSATRYTPIPPLLTPRLCAGSIAWVEKSVEDTPSLIIQG